MNNRGQSLVVFVLIMPILFILITGVWEIGNVAVVQNRYESEVKYAINYGLKHLDEENIREKVIGLLDANLKGTKEVIIENEKITVMVEYDYESIYKAIIKSREKISIKYIGFKENGKTKIEKE